MATRHARYNAVKTAFGAVGASYVATGSLFTATGDYYGVILLNSLDKATTITFDGGNSDFITLEAGEPLFVNFFALNRLLSNPVYSVKHDGVAPTAGSLRISLIK